VSMALSKNLEEAVRSRWKHKTITIPARDNKTLTFKAWVLGSWAVHGRPPAAITHIPTGKMVAMGGTQAETKVAVEEMVDTDPVLLDLPTEAGVMKHIRLLAKWSHKIRGF